MRHDLVIPGESTDMFSTLTYIAGCGLPHLHPAGLRMYVCICILSTSMEGGRLFRDRHIASSLTDITRVSVV